MRRSGRTYNGATWETGEDDYIPAPDGVAWRSHPTTRRRRRSPQSLHDRDAPTTDIGVVRGRRGRPEPHLHVVESCVNWTPSGLPGRGHELSNRRSESDVLESVGHEGALCGDRGSARSGPGHQRGIEMAFWLGVRKPSRVRRVGFGPIRGRRRCGVRWGRGRLRRRTRARTWRADNARRPRSPDD